MRKEREERDIKTKRGHTYHLRIRKKEPWTSIIERSFFERSRHPNALRASSDTADFQSLLRRI